MRFWEIPNTPAALPMKDFEGRDTDKYCWEDWEKEAEKKYPIRYFLNHTMPHWFSVKITNPIEHCIYWIQSHTYRRQHLLDLRQPKTKLGVIDHYRWGYIDTDIVILYACFNSLIEYIEAVDYTYSVAERIKDHKEALSSGESDPGLEFEKMWLHHYEEVEDLHDYWVNRRKESSKKVDEIRSEWYNNRHSDPEHKLRDRLDYAEDEFQTEETNNLIRLMKIRKGLWT